MKIQTGHTTQYCIEIILTEAEARLVAAAIRPKQNALATAVKEELLSWASK